MSGLLLAGCSITAATDSADTPSEEPPEAVPTQSEPSAAPSDLFPTESASMSGAPSESASDPFATESGMATESGSMSPSASGSAPMGTESGSAMPSGSGTTAGPGASGSPGGAGSPVISGTNKTLGLRDAFNAGFWTEGGYQPATAQQTQPGLAFQVGCGDYSSSPLELRFSQASGTLKATVGQASNSPSTGGTLEFSLIADGRRVQAKSVSYQQTAELSADVSSVNLVKIDVKQSGTECDRPITALITNLGLSGG